MLTRIEESGWLAKDDLRLSLRNPPTSAHLSDIFGRVTVPAGQFLIRVLGSWLERALLPYLNAALKTKKKHIAEGEKKHFKKATPRALLAYS